MIAYILRSLAQAVMVMLAVALLAFSMFRFVGDPVANMVGQEASLKERAELAERLGLNDPFPIQFANFVRDMTRGEFGMSYRQGRPVADLLRERVPATVELAFLSSLFALVFGIALGVYTAINRRGILGERRDVALAHRRQPADIPDRHRADLSVRRRAALAALVRARRCRPVRLVVDRAADRNRAASP